ncbi:MAG TPA: arylesterase [Thermoanaerobaculia bacterium]|nr:arylesterase [Thermoanaerobaculia bacterium]HXT50471.1 arylesterase [Thermoanaerobaculia bacterium]
MRRVLLLIALLLLIACRNEQPRAAAPTPSPAATAVVASTTATPAAEPAASPVAPAPRRQPVVVFLGDSLTAGLGLSAEEAWPTLLTEQLAAAGTPIRAVNAGVSGDTSAGGLRRLDWLLRQRPDVVVVELGANDGLRGQPVAGVEANLRKIVERSRAAAARVLLIGLRVPPSLGGEYATRFAELYPRLARELDVPLVPFLLEGVAGDPDLNLPDGIHPNAEGQRRVAAVVRPHLERLLAEPPAATAAR